jgi:thiol-disulfide isomerase/thioredoxin
MAQHDLIATALAPLANLRTFLAAKPIVLAMALATALWPTTALTVDPAPPAGIEIFAGQFPAPDTPFADEQASPKAIKDFKGKIVILNLWATWCAPCVKEMPSLERLAARLPPDRFAVVAVSQDKGGAAIARPFLDRIGVRRLPLYLDPNGRVSRDLGVRGFPTTILIARNGTVLAKLEGPAEWDSEEMIAYLLSRG